MERTDDRQRQPLARRRRLLSFARNRDGATAIEFGILLLPFLLLLFAIIESGVSFAAQTLVANVTDDVARQLRTGEIRAENAGDLRRRICDRLEILVSSGCPGLEIDLKSRDSFAELADIRIRLLGSGKERRLDTAGFSIEPGGSSSKNMLRVFYRWPVITDLMRPHLANVDGRNTLLIATAIWQNEPY